VLSVTVVRGGGETGSARYASRTCLAISARLGRRACVWHSVGVLGLGRPGAVSLLVGGASGGWEGWEGCNGTEV